MRQDIPRKLRPFFLYWAWIILSVCFINLFINYGIRLGYSVVLPEMIRVMNISRRQAGDIFNAYLFAYFSISPFTGYLTDKFGARRIIPLFGILLGCGTILMGTSNALLGASLAFAMVGAGASAMWTPILTVVQRWFSEKKRGLALGILSSGTGLGFAVMGSLHPLIIKTWSWRYSWYIPGGAALAMAVVNALLLHSSPEDVNLKPWGAKNNYNTKDNNVQLPLKRNGRYAEILKARNFWIIGFSYFLASTSLYIVTTFMVDYAHNSLHFTFEKASLLALIHGFAQIAGVLSMPILSDYIGRKMTLIISNFIIGVSALNIVLAGSTELLLFTSVGVLGAFYGITWPMYGACAGDYFRKENIGSIIGAWTPFYGIGAVVAHRIAGHIRDITGSFTGPFLIAIVTALSASALLLFIKSAKKPIG